MAHGKSLSGADSVRPNCDLLVPVTATVDGQPWRDRPIGENEARNVCPARQRPCFIVIGYLSGMRPVLSLERGCLTRYPATGLLLVQGRRWKGVRDPDGTAKPDEIRVAQPVATAITVLEALHDGKLLFSTCSVNA